MSDPLKGILKCVSKYPGVTNIDILNGSKEIKITITIANKPTEEKEEFHESN